MDGFWAIAYKYGWATKDQLKAAVVLGSDKGLTAEQYKAITGEDYTAPAGT